MLNGCSSLTCNAGRLVAGCMGQHLQPRPVVTICHAGFNRTGFVVCSYLVQACGLTVDEALEAFAAARPPGVKHERFVAELHERYAHCCAQSHSGSTSPTGNQLPEVGHQWGWLVSASGPGCTDWRRRSFSLTYSTCSTAGCAPSACSTGHMSALAGLLTDCMQHC